MATAVTTAIVSASTTTAAPAATTTSPGSGGSASNPLLFFVALGFGVLFTNLWIIIGVKYCFRYQNARRRGIPMGSDGVAMTGLHGGRRRREKKLMTREEVESQFPAMTYKAWRAQRERMGLSTEGGVQAVGQEQAQNAREVLHAGATTGRAHSIRSARSRRASTESIAPVVTDTSGVYKVGRDGTVLKDEQFHEIDIAGTEKGTVHGLSPDKRVSTAIEREVPAVAHEPGSPASLSKHAHAEHGTLGHETADENAPEQEVDEAELQHLPDDIGSGDTCAICIDQLEEDDEVRGLSCGHAFHCSCVDVWLTTRRAICPLCKRDYWVRKTPAPGTDGSAVVATDDATPGGPFQRLPRPLFPGAFWRRGGRTRQNADVVSAPEEDLERGPPTTQADRDARTVMVQSQFYRPS